MRKLQPLLGAWPGAMVFALAIAGTGPSNGEPVPKSEQAPSLSETMQAARQAAIDYERTGERLLAQLNDEKLPTKDRAACALALGKLRYAPAIPRLLEFIMLDIPSDDPVNHITKGTQFLTLLSKPLDNTAFARALVDYGELALPAVLHAYLEENHTERRAILGRVLLQGNTKSTRVYLQGLLMENPDFTSRVELLELLPKLQDKKKNKD
jgi:hypothetical protein